ncbi:excisionase [Pseudomonas sp. IT-347P]|uniref:excisionase n=1 Tax=Pseudomonas sp. IT-347P TaxID=3026458 RepID=UPI0039E00EA5
MRYVTVRKFSGDSGYTEAAIRAKIADGTWGKDHVWRKAPDGRVLIDVDGYEAWVEMGKPSTANREDKFRSGQSPAPLMSKANLRSPKPLE